MAGDNGRSKIDAILGKFNKSDTRRSGELLDDFLDKEEEAKREDKPRMSIDKPEGGE